jgi:hypothetical protein
MASRVFVVHGLIRKRPHRIPICRLHPRQSAGDSALVSRSAFVLGHQVDGKTSRFERVAERKITSVIMERVEFGIGDDAGAARGKASPEARVIAKDVKTPV